jgi:hypothetical protein
MARVRAKCDRARKWLAVADGTLWELVSLRQPIIAMNLHGVRRYQLKAHRQGIRDMNENSGPAHRDQIGARFASGATRPPPWSALNWGALVLAVFAGNVVLAIFAWFIVEWAMTLVRIPLA